MMGNKGTESLISPATTCSNGGFSRVTDSSKVALVGLVDILRRGQFHMIDCQLENPHLNSMGARCIDRLDFEQRLAQTVDVETGSDMWHLPAECGELL